MSGAGEVGVEGAPERSTSPHTDATKTVLSVSAVCASTPSTATTKGSRRVQGWQSAVGAGAPPSDAGANAPTLDLHVHGNSGGHGGISFESSVQGSNDFVCSRGASRRRRSSYGTANREAVNFRQSMADFLTVLYGEKKASSAVRSDGRDDAAHSTGKVGPGEEGGPDAPPSAGREPLPYSSSARVAPSARKGPVVKGLTANSGHHAKGDHIDTLVESLMRAYSRRSASARGDFLGAGVQEDDQSVLYNSSRQSNTRRVVMSPRHGSGRATVNSGGHDNNEVSVFVSQAIENILGTSGIRGHGAASNLSILSSFGVDKNLFDLMPFQTKSNLYNNVENEEDSDSVLHPVYVGEPVMFRSLGSHPEARGTSVSKSMRGMLTPSQCAAEGRGCHGPIHVSQLADVRGSRYLSESPGFPGQPPRSNRLGPKSGEGVHETGAEAQAGRGVRSKGMSSMSLDSKALGTACGGSLNDDSWADEPVHSLSVKGNDAGGSAAPMPGRALVERFKAPAKEAAQKTLWMLQEEEGLKRDVMIAVEHQLCGVIASLELEERTGKSGGSADRNGAI